MKSKITEQPLDKVGLDTEQVRELCEAISAVIGELPCNVVLAIQGEDATQALISTRIAPVKSMKISQLIVAGVFSRAVGPAERHILATVAQVIEERVEEANNPKAKKPTRLLGADGKPILLN